MHMRPCCGQLSLMLSSDLQARACQHSTWCWPLAVSSCSLLAVTKLFFGRQQCATW